jgi:hypothetical protein
VVPTDLLLVPAALVLYFCYRLRRRLFRSALGVLVPLAAVPLVVVAGYWAWYYHRPQPGPEKRELAPGVTYARESRTMPRPIVLHVVEIDLTTPGVEVLITPVQPTGEFDLPARTTSQFVREFGVDAAINGSYFYPFRSSGPFDYYPRPGDPVNVMGSCTSDGEWYSTPADGYTLFWVTRENRAGIGEPTGWVWSAVSGRPVLLKDGQVPAGLDADAELNPRTAVAVDRTGQRVWWVVIDGRQPRYSEGVTFAELAALCRDLGAWGALALDGGGSSTVATRRNGKAEVLNCPIHGGHPPGVERPVANHLGVRVNPPPR